MNDKYYNNCRGYLVGIRELLFVAERERAGLFLIFYEADSSCLMSFIPWLRRVIALDLVSGECYSKVVLRCGGIAVVDCLIGQIYEKMDSRVIAVFLLDPELIIRNCCIRESGLRSVNSNGVFMSSFPGVEDIRNNFFALV